MLTYAQPLIEADRGTLVLALRDIAVAIRRERGQRRVTAQQAVDDALSRLQGDRDSVLRLLVRAAEDLAWRWAPAEPPAAHLGGHGLLVEVAA